MSDFSRALLATVLGSLLIPLVGLFGAIGLLVYFQRKGKREMVKGIAVGLAIFAGLILIAGITCFAVGET